MNEQIFGSDHAQVASVLSLLGKVYRRQGNLAAAQESFAHALAINEHAFNPTHPKVAHDLLDLGSVNQQIGAPQEAQKHFQRALAIFETYLPANHPDILKVKETLRQIAADHSPTE
jgi:tetratricopeptide (TPR) repeat protein